MNESGCTSGTPRNDDSSHLSSHSMLVNGRFMSPPIAASTASTMIGKVIDRWRLVRCMADGRSRTGSP